MMILLEWRGITKAIAGIKQTGVAAVIPGATKENIIPIASALKEGRVKVSLVSSNKVYENENSLN